MMPVRDPSCRRSMRGRRLPRALHPMAWWVWALGLAVAVSRTTDPLLLLLVLAVLGLVVAARRSDAPWSRAFKYYLVIALVIVIVRVLFRSVFGGDTDAASADVLLTLPHIPLPSWAAGIQLGGPVTLQGTLGALYGGVQLGVLLCCFGAANSLANPKRALRLLPGALYELGAAVVVSISLAPQLVESVQRTRRARRLRGDGASGFHALRSIAIPVLEDALERSLQLAAAMDCRGYGRTDGAAQGARRLTGALLLGGMCGLCIGVYGLIGSDMATSLSTPLLVSGSVLCVGGLVVGGRRVRHSHYRPDRWRFSEWLVVGCGVVPAAVFAAGAGAGAAVLNPSTSHVAWPGLPVEPMLSVLVAAIAAAASPPTPASLARQAPGAVKPVAQGVPAAAEVRV